MSFEGNKPWSRRLMVKLRKTRGSGLPAQCQCPPPGRAWCWSRSPACSPRRRGSSSPTAAPAPPGAGAAASRRGARSVAAVLTLWVELCKYTGTYLLTVSILSPASLTVAIRCKQTAERQQTAEQQFDNHPVPAPSSLHSVLSYLC